MPHFLYLIIQWISANLLYEFTGGWAPISKKQLIELKSHTICRTQGDPEAKKYSNNSDRSLWSKFAFIKVTEFRGYIAYTDFRGKSAAKFDHIFKEGDVIMAREGHEACDFFLLGFEGNRGGKIKILEEFKRTSSFPDGDDEDSRIWYTYHNAIKV